MREGHRQNDLLLQHCRGYLWEEFVSIIHESEAGPEKIIEKYSALKYFLN